MNPFRGSFIEGRDGINSQKTDWDLNDWILRVASSYFLAFLAQILAQDLG